MEYFLVDSVEIPWVKGSYLGSLDVPDRQEAIWHGDLRFRTQYLPAPTVSYRRVTY